MNLIKKKLMLLWILVDIVAVSLTGCGIEYNIKGTKIRIKYENEEVIDGYIPYDEIYGNIKVVILEQNGTIKPYLMVKEKYIYADDKGYVTLKYINFKNYEEMLNYYWDGSNTDIENTEPDDVLLGKYTTILEEREFYDYLCGYGDIVNNLNATELIRIYDEIEPELIEYISKEYNYTRSISN